MTSGYTLFCFVALGITFGLEAFLRTALFCDRRYWIALGIVIFFQVLVDDGSRAVRL